MTKTLPTYLLAAAIIVAAVLLFIKPMFPAIGAGFIGYQVHQQTGTTTTVGTTPVTLFADQSNAVCHSRVVTTQGLGINISFGEVLVANSTTSWTFSSSSLSNSVGHWQAPSTTVAYDAGLYGCGRMTARATGNTPVTISSF